MFLNTIGVQCFASLSKNFSPCDGLYRKMLKSAERISNKIGSILYEETVFLHFVLIPFRRDLGLSIFSATKCQVTVI